MTCTTKQKRIFKRYRVLNDLQQRQPKNNTMLSIIVMIMLLSASVISIPLSHADKIDEVDVSIKKAQLVQLNENRPDFSKLNWSSLNWAQFNWSDIDWSKMKNAPPNLSQTDWSEVEWSKVMTEIGWSKADNLEFEYYLYETLFDIGINPYLIDWNSFDLSEIDFSDVDLSNINLSDIDLSDIDYENKDEEQKITDNLLPIAEAGFFDWIKKTAKKVVKKAGGAIGAAVGGVIGFATGGPIGAAIGASIGLSIGLSAQLELGGKPEFKETKPTDELEQGNYCPKPSFCPPELPPEFENLYGTKSKSLSSNISQQTPTNKPNWNNDGKIIPNALNSGNDINSNSNNNNIDPDVSNPGNAGHGGKTPIIVNFCDDNNNTTPKVFSNWGASHTRTFFDLDNDKFDEPMWMWPNNITNENPCNAILVVDLNENGIIDNGKEIFDPEGTPFNDAFEVFKDYNSYENVYFWFDEPSYEENLGVEIYGTTQDGELRTLDELGFSHFEFDQVKHLDKDYYIDENFYVYGDWEPAPDNAVRVFAYCESCAVFKDGTTRAGFDAKFDYNNKIGLSQEDNSTNVTFLDNHQIQYTAQKDGEIIIGNHLDNIISAEDKKDVMIFGNAGNDKIDCGLSDNNMCFGGYGNDYLCGSGTKIGGQQENQIHEEMCLKPIP